MEALPIRCVDVDSMLNPLCQVLNSSSVENVLATSAFKTSQPITASADSSVAHVMQLMRRGQIHCVPITDESKVLGLVDVLDVCMFLNKRFSTPSETQGLATPSRLESVKVQEVMDFSKKDAVHAVYARANALDAAHILSRGVQRLCVVRDSRLIALCSQSDVIHFLATTAQAYQSDPSLQRFLNASLKSKGVHVGVTCVHRALASESLANALETMTHLGVSALPVVESNENGVQIVGHLSASDLVHLVHEDTAIRQTILSTTVKDYLSRYAAHCLGPPVCLPAETATIGQALQAVSSRYVHHVWLLNERNEPVGVITGTKLLGLLCNVAEPLLAPPVVAD